MVWSLETKHYCLSLVPSRNIKWGSIIKTESYKGYTDCPTSWCWKVFECKSIFLNPFNFNAVHSQTLEQFERVIKTGKLIPDCSPQRLILKKFDVERSCKQYFFYWVEITAPHILNWAKGQFWRMVGLEFKLQCIPSYTNVLKIIYNSYGTRLGNYL